jgi:cell division septation protein DedD
MNKHRPAALALAACAASLTVAACSAGTPSAGSSTTSSATSAATSSGTSSSGAPSQGASAGSSSAPPTSGPPIAGRTITVKGALGSFPVPAAAKVAENIAAGKELVIVFGSITPADVSRFYATALPGAGFTVTINSMLSKGGDTGALIQFTGHGYQGSIDSLDKFPGASVAGIGDTNVTTVIFTSK